MRKTIDWSHYSEEDHASNIVKVFATLLGNGVEQALYWNMRDSEDVGATVRLFNATEDPRMFKPNRVNRAFRMLCNTLNGARSAPARLPSRAGLWEFHFAGKADVSLVWSDDLDLAGRWMARRNCGISKARCLPGPILTSRSRVPCMSSGNTSHGSQHTDRR